MVVFKLLYLSYMPTTLYFSYFHTNSIDMLYLVHKYKKKFKSTNTDLTHSKIMIFFLAFLVRGYGCSTSHTIVPFTIDCKFRTFTVTHSLAYKTKLRIFKFCVEYGFYFIERSEKIYIS